MPDPKSFKSKEEWMDSCMHQLRKVENKPQGQSVAICLDMWRNKNKKKKSKSAHVMPVSDYLRELATSIIYKYSDEEPEEATAPDLKGFHDEDISKATQDNDNFREVLYTGKNSQLVLMSLKPGQDIGDEVHYVDQFIRLEEGSGEAYINDNKYEVKDDSAIVIPAGSKHNIINTGKGDLKLYSIYSPPHHEDGIIHKTKEDALKDSEEFDGRTTEVMTKTAKIGQTYSYASTQVNLPEDMAKDIIAWGKDNIPKEELANDGFENEIHATVLYGLKSDNPGDVNKLLRHFRPFEVRLGLITHFDAPDFDVLKISVESPVLENMHYFLEKNLDNDNTFPTFHAHVTIAYLKKGMAKKYIGKDYFRGKSFVADSIVFSTRDNKKINLSLQ
jgi:mannose-6-phosphate isomerase-like protein (cupin superfamily)/2'-5' RNA ligase